MRASGRCTKKRLTYIFLGFIYLLVFALPCFARSANLRFTLLLSKEEYANQEPLNAMFKLENIGRIPVWVNKRFYLGSENVSRNRRGEVTLKVISPAGKELECKFFHEAGLPKSEFFKLLEPGGEVISEHPRNLRGYFDFTEPGIYKIVAIYENIFGKEIGLDAFRKKLTAEAVSLKIIRE